MSIGRRHHTTTLLPDGTVLVTGGSSLPGFDEPVGAVYYPELWDPQTKTWTILAAYSRYRGYHSVALLLPDGRVLMAGGGHPNPPNGSAQMNAEIFSPPYLFRGPRPAITSAPLQVDYRETFLVGSPDAASITHVNWVRLPSVTHAFNQNQRMNRLTFWLANEVNGVKVTAPADPNLAPPGHYMLFVLNSMGVPSVARIIRLGAKRFPELHLAVNTPSVHKGDTLTLTAVATPGPTPVTADVYIALQLPGCTSPACVLFWQGGLNFTTIPRPILRNWLISPFNEPIFSHTFGGTEPVGNYVWLGAFTVPGTGTIIGEFPQAPFTFSP